MAVPAALVLAAFVALSPALAKKLNDGAYGCWLLQTDKWPKYELCFRRDGRVETVVNLREEGFKSGGIFKGGIDTFELLGFPGEGWPDENHLIRCNYKVNEKDELEIWQCRIAGRWVRKVRAATEN